MDWCTAPYNNPYNLYSNNFDPGYFNNDDLQLTRCGTTLNINFEADQENLGTLPGQANKIPLYLVGVVYHVYFDVPETGTYTFNVDFVSFGYV